MKTRSHTANTSRSLPSRVMAVLLSAVLFCTGLSLGSFASAEELPVLETDVSQGSSGNLLIGIQGTYIDQISEALDLINSYRLEACQNGYPNPDGSGSLTMSDYEPIQWSDGLEYIARIRAAEASQTEDHVRTNGESCFAIQAPAGTSSHGECLAWNREKNMLHGIEQWYGEKESYLIDSSSSAAGHYRSMISPGSRYIGIGAFYTSTATYANTTCAEFSSGKGSDSLSFTYGECIQKLEVPASDVTVMDDSVQSVMSYGDTQTLQLNIRYSNRKGFTLQEPVSWSSSDTDVVSVSGNTATAVGYGTATLTAVVNGLSYTFSVTVDDNVTVTTTEPNELEDTMCLKFADLEMSLEELQANNYRVEMPLYVSQSFSDMNFNVVDNPSLTNVKCDFGDKIITSSASSGYSTSYLLRVYLSHTEQEAGWIGTITYQLPENTKAGDTFSVDFRILKSSYWISTSGESSKMQGESGSITITGAEKTTTTTEETTTTETTMTTTTTSTTTTSATTTTTTTTTTMTTTTTEETTATTAETTTTTATSTTAEPLQKNLTVSLGRVEVGVDEYEQDHIVSVPIYIDRECSALNFGISWDSRLTYLDSSADYGAYSSAETDGFVWLVNASISNIPAGKIGTLRFRLPDDAEAGDVYVVNLSARAASGADAMWLDNVNGQKGTPLVQGSTITITIAPAPTTTAPDTGSVLYGDVNLDGKVDISDAVLTNKAVSGVVMLNKQQYQNADCDASGEVNADDATLLMKFLVHIVTVLPDAA